MSETTPLRNLPHESQQLANTESLGNAGSGGVQSLRNQHLNSSRGLLLNQSGQTASAASKSVNSSFSMDSRKVVFRVICDVCILLCVGLPILCFFLWGSAYKRGFFCGDESLMHPFHDSTVKSWMLYTIGLGLPAAVMLITELVQANVRNESPKYRIFDHDIPPWVVECYKQIGVFGFGAACSQLVTDIGKYSIGRLRPHFFAVCQPVLPNGSNCSSPENQGKYIVDFICSNNTDRQLIKEVRLSFPSGHSSFSAYTMVYCALYIQSRMTWKGCKLLKHFLQFLLIMLAWATAMSRISNYKHHWSDVMIGALIGTLTALIVANFISDLFDKKVRHLYRKQSTELSDTSQSNRIA